MATAPIALAPMARIQSALADTPALIRQQRPVYLVLLVVAALGGLMNSAITLYNLWPAGAVANIINTLAFIATWFALPAAIRTVQPGFAMTFERLLLFFAMTFGVVVAVDIGLICLVLPGVYLASRIGFAPYLQLLQPESTPFKTSWDLTHEIWVGCLGFLVLSGIVFVAIEFVAYIITMGILNILPAFAVVIAPFCLAVVIYAINFLHLVLVRFSNDLRGQPAILHAATIT